MRIDGNIRPYPIKSPDPMIAFPITVHYESDIESIINIFGYVMTYENEILALAHIYYSSSGRYQYNSLRSKKSGTHRRESSDSYTLLANFSKKAINKIEQDRMKNEYKDIHIKLRIIVNYLILNVASLPTDYLQIKQLIPKSQHSEKSLIIKEDDPSYSKTNYVLFESNEGIITDNIEVVESPILISSSDWVNKFSEPLDLGKIVLVEIPLPLLNIEKTNLTDDFCEKLLTAIHSFTEMEKNFKLGEWNEVIKNSRPIYELLKDKDRIIELLTKSGYTDDMSDSLYESISRLFDYSSKYIHKIDQSSEKKIRQPYAAEKEDAYLIYTNAATMINLLTSKFKKYY